MVLLLAVAVLAWLVYYVLDLVCLLYGCDDTIFIISRNMVLLSLFEVKNLCF